MILASAIIAVALSFQPVQSPQEKGSAESQGAKHASTSENTNSTQKPSQPHPQATPTASQPPASTNQSNGNSEAENVQVQRWIEIFTGVLAGVAVLQLAVMFLTWLVYRRQAGIMEQQRATMQSQWTTMQGQLTQMERQTQSIISKERARITVGKPEPFTMNFDAPNKVHYTLKFSGSTVAYILASSACAATSNDLKTYPRVSFEPSITNLPSEINPINTQSLTTSAFITDYGQSRSLALPEESRKALIEQKEFIHLWGYVRFRDAFFDVTRIERTTTFHYAWKYTDMRSFDSLPSDPPFGFWNGDYREEEEKKPN